jgi:hypothetical protein
MIMQNTAWGSHLAIERAQVENLSLPPAAMSHETTLFFHRGGSRSIYSRVTGTIKEANKSSFWLLLLLLRRLSSLQGWHYVWPRILTKEEFSE